MFCIYLTWTSFSDTYKLWLASWTFSATRNVQRTARPGIRYIHGFYMLYQIIGQDLHVHMYAGPTQVRLDCLASHICMPTTSMCWHTPQGNGGQASRTYNLLYIIFIQHVYIPQVLLFCSQLVAKLETCTDTTVGMSVLDSSTTSLPNHSHIQEVSLLANRPPAHATQSWKWQVAKMHLIRQNISLLCTNMYHGVTWTIVTHAEEPLSWKNSMCVQEWPHMHVK